MIWAFIIILAVLVLAGLFLPGRMPRILWGMTGAAMCFALAGYVWQGNPSLRGQPAGTGRTGPAFDEDIAKLRNAFGGTYGQTGQWMILSDGLARQGKTRQAVNVLGSALRASPDDQMLWVGMGNALLHHGAGVLSPAVEYSYRQAMRVAPEGSAGKYFYGLALARTGQYDEARAIWTALLKRTPERAALYEQLQSDIARLDTVSGKSRTNGRAR